MLAPPDGNRRYLSVATGQIASGQVWMQTKMKLISESSEFHWNQMWIYEFEHLLLGRNVMKILLLVPFAPNEKPFKSNNDYWWQKNCIQIFVGTLSASIIFPTFIYWFISSTTLNVNRPTIDVILTDCLWVSNFRQIFTMYALKLMFPIEHHACLK